MSALVFVFLWFSSETKTVLCAILFVSIQNLSSIAKFAWDLPKLWNITFPSLILPLFNFILCHFNLSQRSSHKMSLSSKKTENVPDTKVVLPENKERLAECEVSSSQNDRNVFFLCLFSLPCFKQILGEIQPFKAQHQQPSDLLPKEFHGQEKCG